MPTTPVRNVVGEGTYGCVVKPSLKCNDLNNHPVDGYENKLSKIMERDSAYEEFEETNKLSTIKGIERFIVSAPHICRPKLNSRFNETIKKCKGPSIRENINKPNKLRLLIVEDGGVDLFNLQKKFIPSMSFDNIRIFLTEISTLIRGLIFFRANGIIHHDIKADNMVYNIETGHARFIDFGLMTSKDDFINGSSLNMSDLAVSCRHFPPETSCRNIESFNTMKKCEPYSKFISYRKFINKTADTFDSYGFSTCLSELFNVISKTNAFKYSSNNRANEFLGEAYDLFREYCIRDIVNRRSNLIYLVDSYDTLLRDYNIYSKSKPSPEKSAVELSKSISLSQRLNKSPEQCAIIPSTQPLKPCASGKERNPATNRCVKLCNGSRQYRNKKFRCITRRKVRSHGRSGGNIKRRSSSSSHRSKYRRSTIRMNRKKTYKKR